MGGGLGGALVRRQGRAGDNLRAAYFPAPTPPGLQVPEVRLGGVGVLKLVTFKELCSFDSESSEKKILSIKYVFLLRIAVSPTLLIVGSVYPPLNTDLIS